ncbi:MAG TPA: thiamine pyrophosphate-dependent dehydrogenase E1 component subunit alpha [Anaerolineae bacterium]|nr:thiamine pyrophosphate-dependent dehydrogenase E1 component subunit alpha [Anaerolineae bacterium]
MPALSPQEFISRDYVSDLSAADLLRAYRLMVLSRKLDERCWILHRQGKIAFHISGIGQEACQLAAGLALTPGKDYYFPHYRDMVTVLALGMRPVDILMGTYGKAGDPGSGGRQMPNHYNFQPANIVSVSSPVTTQVPQCAGVAFAIKLRGEDMVAMCALGEGATSQGDWHEGLNWAGIHKLPFICMVENNNYAISVPMGMQMPVANVADRGYAYGMPGVAYDGNDFFECYNVTCEAVERARRGDGPTLLEARTTRLTAHSSDDDDRTYRDRAELEAQKRRDPLPLLAGRLQTMGVLKAEAIAGVEAEVMREIDKALDDALRAPYPEPKAALEHVFATGSAGDRYVKSWQVAGSDE